MARFGSFGKGAPKSSSTSSAKHRWEKPAGPAAGKTAFDCTGSKKAKNAPSVHAATGKGGFSSNSSFAEASTKTASGRTASKTSETYFRENTFGNQGKCQGKHAFSPAAACAKIFGGACMTLVGLPLLILPGPGLLFIGGGLALALSGVNDLKRAFA